MECKNKEQLINRLINYVIDENDLCYDIKFSELIDEIEYRINKYLNEKSFDYFAAYIILEKKIKPKKFYTRYYKKYKYNITKEIIEDLYEEGILYDFDERYKEEIEQQNIKIMEMEIERDREEMIKEDEEIMKRQLNNSIYEKTLENVFNKKKFIECIKKNGINTETNNNNSEVLEKIENELKRMKEHLKHIEESNFKQF